MFRILKPVTVLAAVGAALLLSVGPAYAQPPVGDAETGNCDDSLVHVSGVTSFKYTPVDTTKVANDFHFYMYQNDLDAIWVTGAMASNDKFPDVDLELDTDNRRDDPPPAADTLNHGCKVEMSGADINPGETIEVGFTLCMNAKNCLKIDSIKWTFDGAAIEVKHVPRDHGFTVRRPFPGGGGGDPASQAGDDGAGSYIHVICIWNEGELPMTLTELKAYASMATIGDLVQIDWDAIPPLQNNAEPPEPPVVIPPNSSWCIAFETTGSYEGGHIYIRYAIEENMSNKGSKAPDPSTLTYGDHPVDAMCGSNPLIDDPCYWPGPTLISLGRLSGQEPGDSAIVSVEISNCDLEMGGFELRVAYDLASFVFNSAELGAFPASCDWEYFTYQFGGSGDKGLIRLFGVADIANGYTPTCFGPPDTGPHELALLHFLIPDNPDLEGQFLPLDFVWDNCTINRLFNTENDVLMFDRAIFNSGGHLVWNEEDDDLYPEGSRPENMGTPDECLVEGELSYMMRSVDFQNGGVIMAGTGCCMPPTLGDIDQSGGVDITDISVLIDNQFLTLTPLVCEDEGDVDFSGTVDITDLSVLIDNQFLTLAPLPPCP